MLLCIENNAVIEVDKLRDAMKVCRNTEGIFFHFLWLPVESWLWLTVCRPTRHIIVEWYVKIVINGGDLRIWKEIISASLKVLSGISSGGRQKKKNHKAPSGNV